MQALEKEEHEGLWTREIADLSCERPKSAETGSEIEVPSPLLTSLYRNPT